MTKHRDQKRRIRLRMKKTGESYTAARRQLLGRAAPAPSVRALNLAEAVAADDLEAALVALALDADPSLEAWTLWAALDHVAARITARVASVRPGAPQLAALLHAFHVELGFSTPDAYREPALHHVHRVLDTRRGSPAALAGLLVIFGRRAGLSLAPVAFPGHFLVQADIGGPVLLDPTSGRPLDPAALVELAAELGVDRAEATAGLAPGDARAVVIRLLQNLGVAHRERGEDGAGLVVADRLYELSGSSSDRCDRGLLLWALGAYEAATEDVAAYVAEHPSAPDAALLDRARRGLSALELPKS